MKSIAKFIVSFILMAIVCEIAWECTAANLYDCTDDNISGFFQPLCSDKPWVHPVGGNPVMVVKKIVHGRSMSDPDEIKEGWTIGRLYCLWLSFVAAALGANVMLVRMRWIPVPPPDACLDAERERHF